MAKHRLIAKVLAGITLVVAFAVGAARIVAEETPKKIRIIYTDDMRGEWLPCG